VVILILANKSMPWYNRISLEQCLRVLDRYDEDNLFPQGITVGKLMEDHLLPRIDVLEMDIDGAEALIFPGMRSRSNFCGR
jgi:hypothetical protein